MSTIKEDLDRIVVLLDVAVKEDAVKDAEIAQLKKECKGKDDYISASLLAHANKEMAIIRLKGLCQDYHSEADSRDAEIERLKQEVKDLEGKWGGEIVKAKIVKELKAQLAAHRETIKMYEEEAENDGRGIFAVNYRQALEDK